MKRVVLAVVAALCALVTLGAASAHGATDEISLSRDGVTWASELTSPLFTDTFAFVPGDEETRSFRVRNAGPTAGALKVTVVTSDGGALLASPEFALEARVGAGPWVTVGNGTTPLQPATLSIPKGAQTTVAVRGTFAPSATGQKQMVVPFQVHLSLSDKSAVGNSGGAAGGLPQTGLLIDRGVLWLAMALIGAGCALVSSRRAEVEIRE